MISAPSCLTSSLLAWPLGSLMVLLSWIFSMTKTCFGPPYGPLQPWPPLETLICCLDRSAPAFQNLLRDLPCPSFSRLAHLHPFTAIGPFIALTPQLVLLLSICSMFSFLRAYAPDAEGYSLSYATVYLCILSYIHKISVRRKWVVVLAGSRIPRAVGTGKVLRKQLRNESGFHPFCRRYLQRLNNALMLPLDLIPPFHTSPDLRSPSFLPFTSSCFLSYPLALSSSQQAYLCFRSAQEAI